MLSVKQCASFAGLASKEILLGVSPSKRHESLLKSYLSNSAFSKAAVRERIVSDLRNFLELGAPREAADRLIVLRRYLSDQPDAQLRPADDSLETEKAASNRRDCDRLKGRLH